MALHVLDIQGKKVGEKETPAAFSIDVNTHLIWEVVTAEMAAKRQGTHKTKERGEVSGGGKKPWKQKGTGRARQGSIRAPNWKGGGTIFGPRPRDYTKTITAKKRRAGMSHILASKVQDNRVVILDQFKAENFSTKVMYNGFTKVVEASPFYAQYSEGRKLRKNGNDNRRKIVLITDSLGAESKKSLSNIPWIEVINVDRLAASTVWYNHGLVITAEAYEKLLARVK